MKKYLSITLATVLMVVGVAGIALAVTDSFTSVISPTTSNGNQSQSYTLTVTNTLSNSSDKVAGIRITKPAGWTSVGNIVVTSPASGWTISTTTSLIQLVANSNGDRLLQSQFVTLTFTATAPNTATSSVWTTSVNTATDFTGTSFTLSGSQPTVVVSIPKVIPTVNWSTPLAITYGTVLSGTELNASSSVSGAYVYTPASGTILDAGLQLLSVLFTPVDLTTYSTTTKTVNLTVNKADQTITWATPADIAYGTALSGTQLNATSTVVGPAVAGALIYNPTSGTILTPGVHTLTVNAAGTTDYNATSSTVLINVIDAVPPVIDSHIDISNVEATSPGGAVVTFTVNSTDNYDGSQPATCSPASGSTFPLGTTTVNCSKTDSSGNVATSTSFAVSVVDTTKPVITLNGSNPQAILVNSSYTEAGATVTDNYDTGLTATIDSSSINTSTTGSYLVTYDAVDSNGNHADQVTRTVNVVDQEAPIITLIGANPQIIEVHTPYIELGATVADNHDIGLVANIDASGVNVDILGSLYQVIYTVLDSSSNGATTTRSVHVVDTTAPVITITGDNPMHVKTGDSYVEQGATVTDNYDTGLTATPSGSVNTAVPGTYFITYTAADSSSNSTSSQRTVIVRALGTDASLSALSSSEGTLVPIFNSTTTAYTVQFPYGSTSTPVVSATTTDPFATSTITQAASATGTATVLVTAEDGTTTQTYTIGFSVAPIPTYTVNFLAGANGSITGSSTQTVDQGSSTESVTATANSGFHFVNWTYGESLSTTTNPLTIANVQGNETYTANFAADQTSGGGSTGGGGGSSGGHRHDTATTTELAGLTTTTTSETGGNGTEGNGAGNGGNQNAGLAQAGTNDTGNAEATTTDNGASTSTEGVTTTPSVGNLAAAIGAFGSFQRVLWWLLILILIGSGLYFYFRRRDDQQ